MQYRLGSRFPLDVSLELRQRGKVSGKFRANNISHGGIFVSGCEHCIALGSFVDVKIDASSFGAGEDLLMKALAVHQSDYGVGLMWANKNMDFHRELEKLRS